MSSYVQNMVDRLRQEPQVSRAEKYVTGHATKLVSGVKKSSLSYKKEVEGKLEVLKSFADDRVTEFRSSESLKGYVYIVLGIMLTVIQLILDFVLQLRDKAKVGFTKVYGRLYSSVSSVFVNVKEKAIELPNTPVGRKVESVSKRVLGDSRHDQAVEFIKSEVFPRFERVILTSIEKAAASNNKAAACSSSPSGESAASGRSTEVGSVASPRQQPKQKASSKRK